MKSIIKNIISSEKRVVATAIATMATALTCSAQNFSKVYDALPDMTLDQAYSALIDFQKANPYFANTYIQLGSICEKKMVMYDPLRETKSIEYWSKNAQLFYGNLKVYYTEGDIRSEFYENLKIPHTGKKITDEDMWNYVNEHKTRCKNHCDSTLLIYSAIENSRINYNKCIEEFKAICDEYADMNEMLLRYDSKLAGQLASLKSHIEECEKQFAEYKRLTKLYPIANYKQIYEKKAIETYRLDGLTNSDFFNNRFTMWDYTAFVENYEKTFNEKIAPLRKEVEQINSAYTALRKSFDKGGILTDAENKPYNELFEYRLGHYDVSSVVAALFHYLDATREMIALAGDSIGRDTGTDFTLTSRKMRRLSQLVLQSKEADVERDILAKAATKEKIARFTDFFGKEYGGVEGFKKFIANDAAYCQSIIDAMSESTASYIARAERQQSLVTDLYSKAGSATAPSVPLWVVIDPQGVNSKYITTHIAKNGNGQIAAVAGYQKGNAKSWFVAGIAQDETTAWQLKLKNVNAVNKITVTSEGVLVSALRQLHPVLIRVDALGKEVAAVSVDAEIVDIMDLDGVSGSVIWTSGNDDNKPVLCVANDGAATASWSQNISSLAKVTGVNVVSDGYLAMGITMNNELAIVKISAEGIVGETKVITDNVEAVVTSQRVSSSEIAVLVTTVPGRHKYVSFGI